ncbi:MAG: hypothetical protein GXN91_01745 [Epsilonproteobacteria bacterium]|nr:hypothetical protein [Campylobacterota bacterium]
MKKGFILIFFLLLSQLYAMSDKELAVSINLAGKQRMLTQKMSKEALLIKLGIDRDKNRQKLKESSSLFDRTLKGLLYGDKELGLVAAPNQEIKKQLKEVERVWSPFYERIKKIYTLKDLDSENFKYIEENNLKLLDTMNKAVFMYAKIGEKNGNKLKMANDINLAGRERMLTQKIAKDLLLYQANLNPKRALKDLKSSTNLFEKTLEGLFNGDKELNLVGTKLPNIRAQLMEVKKEWSRCKPLINKAITTKDTQYTKEAIECLDTTKDKMNKAVELYTKSLNRQKQILKLNALIDSFLKKESSGKHVINLAGRQRMLTQRISKLVIECKLALLKDSCSKLEYFLNLYQKTLIGLAKGDKELNLPATTSKEAIAQINKIIKLWKPFAKEALKVQKSKGKDTKAVKYILTHNEELLKESNRLVSILEKENSKNLSYIEKAQLKIINIAGRQRMLTQKMTKELLAISYLKMDSLKPKLKKSLTIFNNSLNGLIDGDKRIGLPKVTNSTIKKQLLKVKGMWSKIEPFYHKEALSSKETILLLKVNPILLKEMDKAVKLIEVSTEY